jgi:hypothetical protein
MLPATLQLAQIAGCVSAQRKCFIFAVIWLKSSNRYLRMSIGSPFT